MIRLSLALILASVAWSQSNLADASLEQLLNVQVTSVTKKEQTLSRTAAAVFVLNQEEIRRSGARNLPDVLRMVPGVDVAQVDANVWAISVRGFNSRYSNKVLVLVDGRSVYTPTFSGVYWDQLEMPLEDIERIEVIRGPGASVWGANAVNGVINIITKPPQATQGGLVTADGGTQGSAAWLAQYGGAMGQSASYRAWSSYARTGDSILPNGSAADDGWSRAHGGFRADWEASPADSLSVEGDLFANREAMSRYQWFSPGPFDPTFGQELDSAGGSVLADWTHHLDGGSEISLKTYFDGYRRSELGVRESQNTFDLDFQHHFTARRRHDIVWGIGYRVTDSGVPSAGAFLLSPPFHTDHLFSGFIQDEIELRHDIWLTPGIRIEHNSYTGLELEPSLRLAWAPSRRETIWASASRAIRQPSQEEESMVVESSAAPFAPGVTLETFAYGNPRLRSEELRDVETGYRRQWTARFSLDVDGFLGFYRRLSTLDPQAVEINAQPAGIVMTLPMIYGNGASARTYGGELALSYTGSSRWRISSGYSFLRIDSRLTPGSQDQQAAALAGSSPAHMFQVRSSIALNRRLEWGQTLYWYAALPNGAAAAHTRVDSRLGWKAGERAEFSIVGQNLLRPGVMEFGNAFELAGTEVQRAVFGKVTWAF